MRSSPKAPWLRWLGSFGNPYGDWICERCNARGSFPVNCSVGAFLAFVRHLIRDHSRCPEPPPDEPTTPAKEEANP